jgi:hypothetical protein
MISLPNVNANADLRAVYARLAITHNITSCVWKFHRWRHFYRQWFDTWNDPQEDAHAQHEQATAYAWAKLAEPQP